MEQVNKNNMNAMNTIMESKDDSMNESDSTSGSDSISSSPRKKSGYSSVSSESNSSSREEDTRIDRGCDICNSSPCYFFIYKDDILAALNNQFERIDSENGVDFTYNDLNGQEVTNARLRKNLYRYYVYYRHGHLGKGNRVRIESCVTVRIRKLFPEKSNKYLGFRID